MAKSNKTKIKLPFDKEEAVEGRASFKEGDYPVKIATVKTGRSKEKDTPYIGVTYKITDGKYKGKKIEDRMYITPKALGRIRKLLDILSIKVKPKKAMNLDLSKLKGKELAISIEEETYKDDKGKKRKSSRVAYDGLMSLEDFESGGVDDTDDTEDSDNDDTVDSDADTTDDTGDDTDADTTSDSVSIDSDDL